MRWSFRTVIYCYKRLLARWSGRRNLHFIHLRKTGGTAIKSLFARQTILPKWVIHCHPHRFVLADVPAGDAVMFVVRDPLARYVSGFNSRQRQGAPAHHVPWSEAEREAFAHFRTAEALALALDPTAEDHLLAVKAINSITHVRCAYRDWFGSLAALEARRLSIVFIGRTEQLDEDFDVLCQVLKIPPWMRLPSDEKQSNRTRGSQSVVGLSEPARTLLRSWYADDYDFISWCDAWRAEQCGPVARSWFGH